MSNKTRRYIWPVSLVMSLAIIGALAAFLVLVANPGATSAHGAADHAAACAAMTTGQVSFHNSIVATLGGDLCPTPRRRPGDGRRPNDGRRLQHRQHLP